MPKDLIRMVSFSGIDGAGKSTQIHALEAHLRERGIRLRLYTFWDDVVALPGVREFISHKAFKGDKGVGSPENPIVRRDKNVVSWYTTAARLIFYLLDTLSLRLTLARISRSADEFIIFDRYIYDELANLPLGSWAMRIYVRMLLALTPSPDIAFLVDAEPEAAWIRKPEYPLEFLHKNRDAYLALSRFIPQMRVVGPLSVEKTAIKIRQLVERESSETRLGSIDFQLQYSGSRGDPKTPNS
jgi:thymidylate kinase